MKPICLLIVASLITFAAHDVSAQSSEDEKLQLFFKSYLEQYFQQRPVAATALGDHRFDSEMDGISPAARAGWRGLVQKTLKDLPRAVDRKKLSLDGQIDFKLLEHELTRRLWLADNTDPFAEDARTYGNYLVDSVYLLLTQSTQPKEANIANAIARMAKFPRIVAEARQSLTRPAKPVLETAIRQNKGAIYFYQRELFEYVGETPQRATLEGAAKRAVASLEEHQRFLEGLAMTRAQDNWRLGKARFARKFELETDAGVTAEQNLADARSEFIRVHEALYLTARQLWSQYFTNQPFPPDDVVGRRELVNQVIHAVNQEHGEATNLVADARATVQSIKEFIRAHDYLRLPDPDRCQLIEMPEFRRGNSLAYLDNAPPLDPLAPSVYAVSPPPADWTPQQVRSFLEEYNRHMLKILTIHEAYPGHYVQLEYANRNSSLIRRVLQSDPFIEGWAVYGEVSMLNEGYGDGDMRLRLMQLKFYLRAVANSILDYNMHCTQMTDEEGMRFLMDEAFQAEGEAKLKLIRAKQSSVQLSTYFVGRMAHYRLRQQVQRELGDRFELGRYHEAVLSSGSISPKYLRELVRRRLAQPR